MRLCADPDNLPFSSPVSATPGFYIELGNDIAKALGRPFQPVWVPTYYTKRQIRMKLLAGQCDGFVGVPEDAEFHGTAADLLPADRAQLGYALVAPPQIRSATSRPARPAGGGAIFLATANLLASEMTCKRLP